MGNWSGVGNDIKYVLRLNQDTGSKKDAGKLVQARGRFHDFTRTWRNRIND